MVIERDWAALRGELQGIVVAHPTPDGKLGQMKLHNRILLKMHGYKYPYDSKEQK